MQTDQAILVQADIPGVSKEHIDLNIDDNVLSISVKPPTDMQVGKENAEEGTKWHRKERAAMFMQRSLQMPEGSDLMNSSATYENGVLNVTIPKVEVPNKRKRVTVV